MGISTIYIVSPQKIHIYVTLDRIAALKRQLWSPQLTSAQAEAFSSHLIQMCVRAMKVKLI